MIEDTLEEELAQRRESLRLARLNEVGIFTALRDNPGNIALGLEFIMLHRRILEDINAIRQLKNKIKKLG